MGLQWLIDFEEGAVRVSKLGGSNTPIWAVSWFGNELDIVVAQLVICLVNAIYAENQRNAVLSISIDGLVHSSDRLGHRLSVE